MSGPAKRPGRLDGTESAEETFRVRKIHWTSRIAGVGSPGPAPAPLDAMAPTTSGVAPLPARPSADGSTNAKTISAAGGLSPAAGGETCYSTVNTWYISLAMACGGPPARSEMKQTTT